MSYLCFLLRRLTKTNAVRLGFDRLIADIDGDQQYDGERSEPESQGESQPKVQNIFFEDFIITMTISLIVMKDDMRLLNKQSRLYFDDVSCSIFCDDCV